MAAPGEESLFLEDGNAKVEKSPKKGFVKFFVDNWFMITTIIGVIIGFGVGFALQKLDLNEAQKIWLAMPGNIYIRLLQLTILPMIASNIIVVLANLNPKENGKVSAISLGFILLFNLLSALIGIMYGYIIRPGDWARDPNATVKDAAAVEHGNQISYIFKDLMLNIFPDNIVGVALSQAASDFKNPLITATGETTYPAVKTDGTNLIGVLFCSVVFGIAANAAQEKGEPFKQFFGSLGEVVMLLMQKFLLITPLGVMFMVMSSIAEVQDIGQTFISLGFFVLLNFVGIITHLIFLALSLLILCANPFRILKYCLPTYFIAFATTSAIVALPKAIFASDQYGIPKPISRFVLPLAATMKSDASAIFIAASCIFVAQQQSIELDAGKIVIVVILSFAYVSALPNIPSASVVAVVTILSSIGVDAKGASLLFAVEFINDRLRSGNVALSHLYCVAFTYHAVEKDFKDIKEQEADGDDESLECDDK
ncbi:unnamed protein product [Hymenolepis diminuta]|uniref:Amino acid transporter n=2 Tax=Hymenolepis diminuta TaxID=6216 RepID=A0A564ZAL3_HYMDI|nr:unnamed protein product [Hymenolepis diminuta]